MCAGVRNDRKFIRAASGAVSAVLLFLMFATGFGQMAGASPLWEGGMFVCPAGQITEAIAPPALSAKAAVLMEAETGSVILSVSPDTRLPMASTTKILTALVALETLSPETVVTIAPDSVGVEGSSIYLTDGETLTLEDLLYALLLESANDAAVAIAVAVAGSVPAFADLMNARAQALGATSSHFANPHGLDDPEHYTTARELALITREALRNPDFRRICSTKRHTIPLHNTEGVRLLLNHNKLLASYDGCIGVKTGFTKKTGRCLVSAAERDGLTLIAVTLGAPDDWRDHTAMLDYGFALYQSITLCEPGDYAVPLPLLGGDADYVIAENTDTLCIPLRRDHGAITCVVERRQFDFAPITGGETVGRLLFYEETSDGRRLLGEVPLTAAYTVAVEQRPGFFTRLWSWLCNLFD